MNLFFYFSPIHPSIYSHLVGFTFYFIHGLLLLLTKRDGSWTSFQRFFFLFGPKKFIFIETDKMFFFFASNHGLRFIYLFYQSSTHYQIIHWSTFFVVVSIIIIIINFIHQNAKHCYTICSSETFFFFLLKILNSNDETLFILVFETKTKKQKQKTKFPNIKTELII